MNVGLFDVQSGHVHQWSQLEHRFLHLMRKSVGVPKSKSIAISLESACEILLVFAFGEMILPHVRERQPGHPRS